MSARTASSCGIAPGNTIINVARSCAVRFARPHSRAFHIRDASARKSLRANSSCGTPESFLNPRTETATAFCMTAARNFDTATGSPPGSGGLHTRLVTSTRPNDSRGEHQSRGWEGTRRP